MKNLKEIYRGAREAVADLVFFCMHPEVAPDEPDPYAPVYDGFPCINPIYRSFVEALPPDVDRLIVCEFVEHQIFKAQVADLSVDPRAIASVAAGRTFARGTIGDAERERVWRRALDCAVYPSRAYSWEEPTNGVGNSYTLYCQAVVCVSPRHLEPQPLGNSMLGLLFNRIYLVEEAKWLGRRLLDLGAEK